MKIIPLSFLPVAILLSGCAVLHHIQVGSLDNRQSVTLKPIEVKVSETGIDLNDVKLMSSMLLSQGRAQETNDALRALEYFQMGPHTGAGVYSLEYIKDIQKTLRSMCVDGTITGIMTVRETRKYPIVSGEIVKIKAYCATTKGA